MALGLENLVAFNCAELTDGTIHWAEKIRSGRQADTIAQGAGEELVEALVTGRIGVGRFCHVDVVTGNKAADQGSGQAAQFSAGKLAGELGQKLLGEQILR